MPALSFSGTTSRGPFWKLILNREKTQTCRKPRKHHIKPGDPLKLYWKQRIPAEKKPIHFIGYARCINVARMRLGDFAWDDEFARRDGFRDSAELREWFNPEDDADLYLEEYDVIQFKLGQRRD